MTRQQWAFVIGIAGLLLLVWGTLLLVGQESGEAGLAVVELRSKPPVWVHVASQVVRWLGPKPWGPAWT